MVSAYLSSLWALFLQVASSTSSSSLGCHPDVDASLPPLDLLALVVEAYLAALDRLVLVALPPLSQPDDLFGYTNHRERCVANHISMLELGRHVTSMLGLSHLPWSEELWHQLLNAMQEALKEALASWVDKPLVEAPSLGPRRPPRRSQQSQAT